ncbi:MAG: cysteine desulfurase family protein [Acidimicrobiia bacterium]
MHYLDCAASAPMRPEASAALIEWSSCANPTGVHAPARAAKAALEAAREQVAAACGARVSDVTFTSGGTEADNLALIGAARAARVAGRGDGVVVSAIEHKAILAAATQLQTEGFRVQIVAPDPSGVVPVDAFRAACDSDTVAAACMLVNNETGVMQPVNAIGDALHSIAPHAVLVTDAVQGAAWCDLAADTANADCIALSAHKVGGPKGIGALVIRPGVALEPILVGGGQEHERRGGTQNVAGAAAFGVALEYTQATRAATWAHVAQLRARLQAGLLAVPGAFLNGDPQQAVPGIVSAGFPGVLGELVVIAADRADIACSAGASCASGATNASHVLEAMGRTPDEARASVRLSMGYATIDADIDAVLAVLPACIDRIRSSAVVA